MGTSSGFKMAETSYTQGEQAPPQAVHVMSPEGQNPGRPDVAPSGTDPKEVDTSFWEQALADCERAERDWRTRGREIVQMYRGDIPISRPRASGPKSGRSTSAATGSPQGQGRRRRPDGIADLILAQEVR